MNITNIDLSSEDLKLVVDQISLLLMNERHNYVLKFEEDKLRISTVCRHDLYGKLPL